MDMRKALIVAVVCWDCSLAACNRFAGRSDDGVTYRYAETDVLMASSASKLSIVPEK